MDDKTSLLPWLLIAIMALSAAYIGQSIAALVGAGLLLWLKLIDLCIEDEERKR